MSSLPTSTSEELKATNGLSLLDRPAGPTDTITACPTQKAYIVMTEDAVRASQAEEQLILERSYRAWSSYSKEAHLQNGLQADCIQLQNILERVPAYLASTQGSASHQLKLEQRGSDCSSSELFIGGWSTWRTGGSHSDLEDKVIPHQLLLGTQHSTVCGFAADSRFADWPGIQSEGCNLAEGNYLAILAFAWAYILSASWVEMQKGESGASVSAQREDRMLYLCDQPKCISYYNGESEYDELDIVLGDVDNAAEQWWTAIMATGEGWRAEIRRNGIFYRSPWSISIAGTHKFKLRRLTESQNLKNEIFVPPSSKMALGYLSDFCILHNIRNQCSAALAATLTFPYLSKRTATLPLPKPVSRKMTSQISLRTNDMSSIHTFPKMDIVLKEIKFLPYYMTLSCNTRGIEALLCGSFFDPEVSCNLVGSWLEPIFEVIDPLIARADYEILAIVMGKRQPKLAPLWLGAIISGASQIIFKHVRMGPIAVELHASAWTATTHTFISLSTRPITNDVEISRSDECRLLYFANYDEHSRVPVSPWKPFGTTPLCNTDIDVRRHVNCAGHYLRYLSWSWDLIDGTGLEDWALGAHPRAWKV